MCWGRHVSPGPTFNFALVGPGSRNFNGNHKSGCLHGDAFFHRDIIPECPWPSSLVREPPLEEALVSRLMKAIPTFTKPQWTSQKSHPCIVANSLESAFGKILQADILDPYAITISSTPLYGVL